MCFADIIDKLYYEKKENPIVQMGYDALSTQGNIFDSERLDGKSKCHPPQLNPKISLGDVKALSKYKTVK